MRRGQEAEYSRDQAAQDQERANKAHPHLPIVSNVSKSAYSEGAQVKEGVRGLQHDGPKQSDPDSALNGLFSIVS